MLLGNYQTADDSLHQKSVFGNNRRVNAILKTNQPDAKRFSALYTWLKFPGIEPVVDMEIGSKSPSISRIATATIGGVGRQLLQVRKR